MEGDGYKATDVYKFPAVYADAVGDLDKVDAKWGPSISHFQIRSLREPTKWGPLDVWRVASKLTDLEHPKEAAKYATDAAFAISKGGTDFTPWSAFKSGSYLQYKGKDYMLVTGHPRATEWDA